MSPTHLHIEFPLVAITGAEKKRLPRIRKKAAGRVAGKGREGGCEVLEWQWCCGVQAGYITLCYKVEEGRAHFRNIPIRNGKKEKNLVPMKL